MKMASEYKKFETRTRIPDPNISALLVIDVQNHFSDMAGPIMRSLNNTIYHCRRASVPIFFTRHYHKSPDDYGMLDEWWSGDIIRQGTHDSKLMDDLDYRKDSENDVIHKTTYSAFRGTGLEEKLVNMGVKEVIITGVMTNLCCETTAREAFVRGFRVFFSKDATATSSMELHEATLKNMAYGFAYLVDQDMVKEACYKPQ